MPNTYLIAHARPNTSRISPIANIAPFALRALPLFSLCSPAAIIFPNHTIGWGSLCGSPKIKSSNHPTNSANGFVPIYQTDFLSIPPSILIQIQRGISRQKNTNILYRQSMVMIERPRSKAFTICLATLSALSCIG